MWFKLSKFLFGVAELAIGAWLIYRLKLKFDDLALTTTATFIFWPALLLAFLGLTSFIEFIKNKKLKVLKVNVLIFFGLLFLGELALRQFMFYSTYFEKNNQEPYVSIYEEPSFDSLGFHRLANAEFNYNNGEFEYARKCNNWGYTNRKLPLKKPENEVWFFVLGDSFCEGAGVDFNLAVPAQLEKYFTNYDSTYTIKFFNFGMAGSDVVFEYYLWQNHIKNKNPDGVIVLQNTTDIQDLKIRGGEERFIENFELNYRPQPSWEWIYASSHIIRAFFHRVFGYDFSLIHSSEQKQLEAEAMEVIVTTLEKIKLDNKHTFSFSYPQLEEYKNENYTYQDFENWTTSSTWNKDLSASFFELKQQGVLLEEIYWPMDRHFNEKGYTLLSNFIVEEMEPKIKKIIAEKPKIGNPLN